MLLLLYWGEERVLSAKPINHGRTIREQYTKHEYRIPMRDGVRLFTAVYLPKDSSHTYPILMMRTPYGCAPYGQENYRNSLGPSDLFAEKGYAFVYQDVRGCYLSEGTFVNMRPLRSTQNPVPMADESTDSWDTIEWLLKHVSKNNGRVGIWGISYPGFYAAVALVDAHPALKAVSPQAPIADWFLGDDFHHNGAFFLPHAFNFLAAFGRPRSAPSPEVPPQFQHGTQDGYRFCLRMGPLSGANDLYLHHTIPFWDELMVHENYDRFWQDRCLLPHLKGIRPAVMTVGGWFDAEDLFGPLHIYQTIEQHNPDAYNNLVMGPWSHGGWAQGEGTSLGDLQFGSSTASFYRQNIELPFFESWLQKGIAPAMPEAWVFETGSNQWRQHSQWPPANTASQPFYFQSGGRFSFDPPQENPPVPYDEYPSDPAKPVPFQNQIAIGMSYEYMTSDQRFASTRPDVLVFESEELQEGLTLAGPIRVVLHVSTSGTDSDWIVKLIDVFPESGAEGGAEVENPNVRGCQALIRGDVFRGRFHRSFENPQPMVPNEPTRIEFTLWDVFHTFRSGHKLMVQVQSSWFPLVDRNPQKFVSIRNAGAEDFQKAIQRVYHSLALPSFLTFPVLNSQFMSNEVSGRGVRGERSTTQSSP